MNIVHSMCFVIQRAHSLEEVLQSAVELIASEMGTDVCSIYLLDPGDKHLHLMATQGLDRGALGKVRLALGEGLTGTVVQEMPSRAAKAFMLRPDPSRRPKTTPICSSFVIDDLRSEDHCCARGRASKGARP